MTPTEFLEVIVSISLQVAFLIVAAYGVAKLAEQVAAKSRIWGGCYWLILGLTLRAFLLPRLRPLQLWPSLETSAALEIVLWERRLGLIIASLWLLGVFYSLAKFAFGWLQVRRFLKTCRPLSESERQQMPFANPRADFSPAVSPQFLISRRLRSPFCWQVHQPLIVLPEFLLEFEPGGLQLVVRHELEHLRTGHPLTLFVQRLVEILFWFHPMVWWSSRQAAMTREFACDEAAVQSRRDIAAYLRSLLKIVERAEAEPESQTIELAFGRGSGLIAQRATRLATMAQRGVVTSAIQPAGKRLVFVLSGAAVLTAIFLWTPLDLTKSPRSTWSPWPKWSAATLHAVGIHARDYDIYDHRFQFHELLEEQQQAERQTEQ